MRLQSSKEATSTLTIITDMCQKLANQDFVLNWKRDALRFTVPLTALFLLKAVMYIRTSIRKTDPKQKKSVFAATATAIVFFDQHSFHAK